MITGSVDFQIAFKLALNGISFVRGETLKHFDMRLNCRDIPNINCVQQAIDSMMNVFKDAIAASDKDGLNISIGNVIQDSVDLDMTLLDFEKPELAYSEMFPVQFSVEEVDNMIGYFDPQTKRVLVPMISNELWFEPEHIKKISEMEYLV